MNSCPLLIHRAELEVVQILNKINNIFLEINYNILNKVLVFHHISFF